MKKTLISLIVVVSFLGGLGFAVLHQPDVKKQPTMLGPSMNKKQVEQMLATKGPPGDEHKVLESLVGTFDIEMKVSMQPGTQPIVVKSEGTSQWVLGKRFVSSTIMPIAGEELKIEVINYLGFDRRTKKYIWWEIDNTDTYSVAAEGEYDAATKTITLLGENAQPGAGKMKFKSVFVLSKPDGYAHSISYQVPEDMRAVVPKGAIDKDGWFTVVDIAATRKK